MRYVTMLLHFAEFTRKSVIKGSVNWFDKNKIPIYNNFVTML